jgi:hypothetical protein
VGIEAFLFYVSNMTYNEGIANMIRERFVNVAGIKEKQMMGGITMSPLIKHLPNVPSALTHFERCIG